MRGSFIGLAALCCISSCMEDSESIGRQPPLIRARLAPDTHTMRELETSIMLWTFPELAAEPEPGTTQLGRPPAMPLELRGRSAKLETTPKPSAELPREPAADPYAELEPTPAIAAPKAKPRPHATKPLAPRAQATPATRRQRAPSHLSRDIALGIGGAGLGVSALAVGSNLESSSDGAYVFAGVALGIGVVGLATAGILTLTEDDTKDVGTVRVRSTAGGLAVDF